ncbi:MAG: glycosyltransferase [Candidatus Arsenophonus phytopathogenicus]
MRRETFISIIFPFYNESERLESVIESIYNQKFKYKLFDLSNTELIFLDNNSTDNSASKIITCQKNITTLIFILLMKKFKVFLQQEKKGWIMPPNERKNACSIWQPTKTLYCIS